MVDVISWIFYVHKHRKERSWYSYVTYMCVWISITHKKNHMILVVSASLYNISKYINTYSSFFRQICSVHFTLNIVIIILYSTYKRIILPPVTSATIKCRASTIHNQTNSHSSHTVPIKSSPTTLVSFKWPLSFRVSKWKVFIFHVPLLAKFLTRSTLYSFINIALFYLENLQITSILILRFSPPCPSSIQAMCSALFLQNTGEL